MDLHGPCNICGTYKARFVRDHNHKTMFIRGILCDLCNSWLALYEQYVESNIKLNPRVSEWVVKFQVEIDNHLRTNTGITYWTPKTEQERKILKESHGPISSGTVANSCPDTSKACEIPSNETSLAAHAFRSIKVGSWGFLGC